MTMANQSAEENDLIERARRVLPAGGFGNFQGDVIIRSGKAARVWDVSGNEYVDFLLGSGPMYIGHGHPKVLAAVEEQLARGTTFFASNEYGIELAEEIVKAVDCAEQVRYVSSGSEADMYAMRLARAHRGRPKILKFEGGYHGMSDYALMSMAPKTRANFPQAVPDSAGLSRDVQNDVLVAPFNDIEAARRMIAEYEDELGGVIVEPFQRLVPPAPGFLEALREETEERGIPLIFDEVVTGFRFAYGGAQELYGVTPDLCTLGKIIGGGFPLAAIAGKEEIMAHFDHAKVGDDGFTFQVGTLSGNPVAAVAGLATLEVLREDGAYEQVYANGERIMAALRDSFDAAGIPAAVVGQPTLFDIVFTDGPVNDYRDFTKGDPTRAARFNDLLRERGLLKGPSKFYMALAHDDADIAQTIGAISEAAEIMGSEA